MKKILKNILQGSGAVVIALAVFFSTANSYTVFAGYSSPRTVSIAKPGYGTVNNSKGATVYASASTNAATVATLPNESYVMIVGLLDGFYMVQYNTNGNYGYVPKDNIDFCQTEHYLKVKDISGTLNFRAYASTSANIIATLPPNKSFGYFYDVTSSWYCGLYGNETGAVSASYVTRENF